MDKDLLTLLSSEDSKRVADAIIEAQRTNDYCRSADHEVWKKTQEDAKRQQEEAHESRMQLDQRYRSHVSITTTLNVITTGLVCALFILLIKVLV